MYKNTHSFFLIPIILMFLFSISAHAQYEQHEDWPKVHFVNWETSKSMQLDIGEDTELECISHEKVSMSYNNSSDATLNFPRTGYYIFTKNSGKDTLIANVYKTGEYKNRLSDIIRMMSIKEKFTQLSNEVPAIPELGLPKYDYWNEALHGVARREGVTAFPQVIGLGSTWDTSLIKRMTDVISDEARILYKQDRIGLTFWSPDINIARDPRWGRNEESYSEDPHLLSQMGVAFIKGMQGDNPDYFKTIATPKHFVANNEEDRRHSGSSDVDMRSLWEYYMPAFEAAITEGKAYSIMSAYNAINQVPASANNYMLDQVLRKRWDFNGYVVSDCGAVSDVFENHHYSESAPKAVAKTLKAGCDLNCGGYYREYLEEAYNKNLITEAHLDTALTRLLSARFRLGEFDPPKAVPYSSIPQEKLDSENHRELALEIARKSMVLLKNDGMLPLNTEKLEDLAVIGPNAKETVLGLYSGTPNISISPYQGIAKKAGDEGIDINYAKGCEITGAAGSIIPASNITEAPGTEKSGFKAEYYNNTRFNGDPALERVDKTIDFDWGNGSPADKINADKFSVRWTGKIIAPKTGTISINPKTDDGVRLYYEDELVIDDWNDHAPTVNTAKVDVEKGETYKVVMEYYENSGGAVSELNWNYSKKEYSEAVNAAKNSDAVIMVLGTNTTMFSEGNDRENIALPKTQRELLKAIKEVTGQITVVLINGAPVTFGGMEDDINAVLEAWYPGQAGGTAIADVLFGDYNPGGKLSQTFYKSDDQLPQMADYDLINHERTYMYLEEEPLYPFGHGLSYTSFGYSNLSLNSGEFTEGETIQASVKVENTGSRKGDEVVQVYIKDISASVKVPRKELKAFQRITLDDGETQRLKFRIPVSELNYYDILRNKTVVEPGRFEIQVGSSSEDIRLKKQFAVKGDDIFIADE